MKLKDAETGAQEIIDTSERAFEIKCVLSKMIRESTDIGFEVTSESGGSFFKIPRGTKNPKLTTQAGEFKFETNSTGDAEDSKWLCHWSL